MDRQYDTIKAKKDWIIILDQYLKKNKYGYEGDIIWRTERNKNIQRISSIHIDEHHVFNKLFFIVKNQKDVQEVDDNHLNRVSKRKLKSEE